MDSIKRILVLARRNILEILREPLSLIFMLATPLLMLVLFYFAFSGLTAQFEMKYLAPGIVIFAQAFVSLFAGLLISSDRNSSFLTRLYVSKAKSYEFIIGYTLALIPLALLQAVIFFAVGGIIDSSLWSVSLLFAVLASVIPALMFIGFGILFGSLCSEKSVGGVSSVVICAQSVLSGMWFPLDGLSEGFVAFMNVLPFKNATALLTNITMGHCEFVGDILVPMLIVLAYTIVIFTASVLMFGAKMKSK